MKPIGFLILISCWSASLFSQDTSFFLKRLGVNESQEVGWTLANISEGYIVAGGQDDRSFIRAYNDDDQLLWHRTFDFTNEDDYIRKIQVDSEGNLIGVGRNILTGGDRSFIFRYDYQNDQILWVQRVAFNDESRFDEIVESGSNGNFFVYGQSSLDPGPGFGIDLVAIELDRVTGSLIDQVNLDQGQTDVYYDAISTSNGMYAVGVERYNASLNSLRPIVSRFTEDGEFVWSRTFIEPINGSARLYFTCVIDQPDTLVLSCRGTLTGQDLTNSQTHLVKMDYQGNIIQAVSLDIVEGDAESPLEIVEVTGGYIICGQFTPEGENFRNIFLIRTDHNFNPIWARSIGNEDTDSSRECIWVNGAIYFSGYTQTSTNRDALLGKVSIEGSPEEISNCDWFTEITIESTSIDNPSQELSVHTPYQKEYVFEEPNVSSLIDSIAVDSICGNTPCEPPFVTFELQQLCPDSTADLVIDSISGNGPFLYSLDGGQSFFTDPNLLANLTPGSYTFVVLDDNGCMAEQIVTVSEVEPGSITVESPLEITQGDSIPLIINFPGGISEIMWAPEGSLSCFTCIEPLAFPDVSTIYSVTLLDDNGCLADAEIEVVVLERRSCEMAVVEFPNIFTPDGDGINDAFRLLDDHDDLELTRLQVYNRWGELIFSTDDPQGEWDGTQNGEACNQDTYIFLAETTCQGEIKVYHGEVTLIR